MTQLCIQDYLSGGTPLPREVRVYMEYTSKGKESPVPSYKAIFLYHKLFLIIRLLLIIIVINNLVYVSLKRNMSNKQSPNFPESKGRW